MTFTLVKKGGEHQENYRAKTETLHVEDWYRNSVSERRLNNTIDSLWDKYGDIVADERGKLYIAEKDFRSDEHFGGYCMWAEVEYVEAKKVEVIKEQKTMNRKRIHTIWIWYGNRLGAKSDFEVHGGYKKTKQNALDFLGKLEPNATIGILWTWQDFLRSPSNPDIFTGKPIIVDVISACAEDNRITVAEAVNLIKTTSIDERWETE